MDMHALTAFEGRAGRLRRAQHDGHAADRGHAELEPLTTPQSGRFHDLHFGELVVEVANTVDGIGAEMDPAPEFTDSELRGWRDADKYMSVAPRLLRPRGVVR